MSFRQSYRKDLAWRVLDAAGHMLLAVVLPYHLFQYVPDILVPIIWLRSMCSNKFLPETDLTLRIHLWLHDTRLVWGLLVVLFVLQVSPLGLYTEWVLWLWIHILLHQLLDRFTHRSWNHVKTCCGTV